MPKDERSGILDKAVILMMILAGIGIPTIYNSSKDTNEKLEEVEKDIDRLKIKEEDLSRAIREQLVAENLVPRDDFKDLQNMVQKVSDRSRVIYQDFINEKTRLDKLNETVNSLLRGERDGVQRLREEFTAADIEKIRELAATVLLERYPYYKIDEIRIELLDKIDNLDRTTTEELGHIKNALQNIGVVDPESISTLQEDVVSMQKSLLAFQKELELVEAGKATETWVGEKLRELNEYVNKTIDEEIKKSGFEDKIKQISGLEEQLRQLTPKVGNLEGGRDHILQKIDALDALLNQRVSEWQGGMAVLTQNLTTLTTEIRDLKLEDKRLSDRLGLEIEKLNNILTKRMDENFEEIQATINDLIESERNNLNSTQEENLTVLTGMRDGFNQLENRFAQLGQSVPALTDQIKQLKDKNEQQRLDMEHKMKELADKNEQLRATIDQVNSRVVDNMEGIEQNLERKNDEQRLALEGKETKLTDQIKQLEDKNDQLEASISRVNSMIEDKMEGVEEQRQLAIKDRDQYTKATEFEETIKELRSEMEDLSKNIAKSGQLPPQMEELIQKATEDVKKLTKKAVTDARETIGKQWMTEMANMADGRFHSILSSRGFESRLDAIDARIKESADSVQKAMKQQTTTNEYMNQTLETLKQFEDKAKSVNESIDQNAEGYLQRIKSSEDKILRYIDESDEHMVSLNQVFNDLLSEKAFLISLATIMSTDDTVRKALIKNGYWQDASLGETAILQKFAETKDRVRAKTVEHISAKLRILNRQRGRGNELSMCTYMWAMIGRVENVRTGGTNYPTIEEYLDSDHWKAFREDVGVSEMRSAKFCEKMESEARERSPPAKRVRLRQRRAGGFTGLATANDADEFDLESNSEDGLQIDEKHDKRARLRDCFNSTIGSCIYLINLDNGKLNEADVSLASGEGVSLYLKKLGNKKLRDSERNLTERFLVDQMGEKAG